MHTEVKAKPLSRGNGPISKESSGKRVANQTHNALHDHGTMAAAMAASTGSLGLSSRLVHSLLVLELASRRFRRGELGNSLTMDIYRSAHRQLDQEEETWG